MLSFKIVSDLGLHYVQPVGLHCSRGSRKRAFVLHSESCFRENPSRHCGDTAVIDNLTIGFWFVSISRICLHI